MFRCPLQFVYLPSIERIRRLLDGQDRVEIIAVPLHAVAVDVAGALHRDELFICQRRDVLHHGIDGKADCGGDGVIAGMALVRAAIFTAEQIGVDCDCSVAKPKVKHFVRHGEKSATVYTGQNWDEIGSEQSTVEQGLNTGLGHLNAHPGVLRQFLRRGSATELPAVTVLEIRQYRKGRRFQFPLPDLIGQRETMLLCVTLIWEKLHWQPPSAWTDTHAMNFSLDTTIRLPTRTTGKSGWCISSYALEMETPSAFATVSALINSGRSS